MTRKIVFMLKIFWVGETVVMLLQYSWHGSNFIDSSLWWRQITHTRASQYYYYYYYYYYNWHLSRTRLPFNWTLLDSYLRREPRLWFILSACFMELQDEENSWCGLVSHTQTLDGLIWLWVCLLPPPVIVYSIRRRYSISHTRTFFNVRL